MGYQNRSVEMLANNTTSAGNYGIFSLCINWIHRHLPCHLYNDRISKQVTEPVLHYIPIITFGNGALCCTMIWFSYTPGLLHWHQGTRIWLLQCHWSHTEKYVSNKLSITNKPQLIHCKTITWSDVEILPAGRPNEQTIFFIYQDAFENLACKVLLISFKAQYVDPSDHFWTGSHSLCSSYLNSMDFSVCSHPSCRGVIAVKFCTWHNSCAVLACAKCCNDMWYPTMKLHLIQFSIEFELRRKTRSWNGPWVRSWMTSREQPHT